MNSTKFITVIFWGIILMIDQEKRKEIKNKLKKLSSIKDQKFIIKIDLTTMNFLIAFIVNKSSFKTRRNLSNINKLFEKIDESSFNTPSLKDRAWIIKKMLYVILVEGFESDLDYIISYLNDDPECTDSIKDILGEIKNFKINYDECKHIVGKVSDMLEYGYMVIYKELMTDLLNMIDDDTSFKVYKSIQQDLYDISVAIMNIKRNTRSIDSEQVFSLDPDIFEACVEEAVIRLQDKNKVFQTGCQRWNTLLSPGYISKRLYIYLAFPGKGKSTVLLKSALDIKKYNPDIETKDPDKKPTVLFLTLENTLEETIERIYNMTVDTDDIRNYTSKQVIKKLRKDGGLEITDKNRTNIVIREYKNREIDTNDLYTIIQDENDKGNEVVALVIDYIKRIRPAERAGDEKGELKNISNELKEVAKFFDIPVITAQQLNRASAAVVDAALQNNKDDVTRLIGREGVSGAWEINNLRSPHTVMYDKKTTLIAGTVKLYNILLILYNLLDYNY